MGDGVLKDKDESRVAELEFKRFTEDGMTSMTGLVPVQKRVEIFLNGRRLAGLSCLPGDLKSLAAGFVLTEGFVRTDELASLTVEERGDELRLSADVPDERITAALAGLRLASDCSGSAVADYDIESVLDCGKPFNLAFQIEAKRLLALVGEFVGSSELHRRVGGVHSAALSAGKKLDYFADDISRHSAVDRVVGRAALAGDDVSSMLLITTGRLSAEMVLKAARVRIPLVASLLSVTAQAVELAGRFHITLCGRCSPHRLDIYTGEWRLMS